MAWAGDRLVTALPPPWEIDGLPYELGDEIFPSASDAWVLHEPQEAGAHRIRPAMGIWGHYAVCSGNDYEHIRVRTTRLLRREPLYVTNSGGGVYSAIFGPDPTPGHDGAIPLAVITAEGYIGSAWSTLASEYAPRVLQAFRPDVEGGRLLYATVVHVRSDPGDPQTGELHRIEVWVPRPGRD